MLCKVEEGLCVVCKVTLLSAVVGRLTVCGVCKVVLLSAVA